ncbi:MAG: CotH kinase family protein [Oscillospiraceae bacterium]|nr:CotH kinase family protein [Oscillospiraceae bacterium]
MSKNYRILSAMLASILAISSTGMNTVLSVNAVSSNENIESEAVEELSVSFNNQYASAGSEMSVTVSGADEYSLAWYINNEKVSTENTYVVSENDLEKFLRVDVVSGDEVVASQSIYCSNLPVLYIDCDDFNKMNWSASHDDYYSATMKVQGNSLYNNDKQLYDGDIQIKGRGSSTWGFDKKPYKIKLDSKTDMFGMGKNKHWVLMANYNDGTFMRNQVANTVAKDIGVNAMDSIFVDVVVNGEYQGNYQFCEHIRVDKNRVDIYDYKGAAEDAAGEIYKALGIKDKEFKGRLEDAMSQDLSWMTTGNFEFEGTVYDVASTYSEWSKLQKKIAKTDGYLLEMAVDANTDESYFFTSKNVGISSVAPEFLRTNDEMMNSVKTTIQNFEDAVYSKTGNTTINGKKTAFNELCNMESLLGYWTVGMTFMNEIGHRSNYMYIENNNITFGPVWDFDWAMGNEIPGWPTLNYNQWINQGSWAGRWFYEVGKNDYFAIKEQEYYWKNRDTILSYFDTENPDSYVNQIYNEIYTSAKADDAKWKNTSYEKDFETMITWMNKRIGWLDEQFATEESIIKSLDGTVSSNLSVSVKNADGSAIEADDISVIAGGGKIQTGKDFQITGQVGNPWEANYMDFYVNNVFVETVKTENGKATVTLPADYFTSEIGTKNVVQVYGKNSPDSEYFSCSNFISVVQYEGENNENEEVVTTTTTVPVTTTTTTTTAEPTTSTTTKPETTTNKPATTTTTKETTITTTTTKPITTTTKATTTTAKPTTTTTTTTTAKPITTTTKATTTTAKPTTTTTITTTTEPVVTTTNNNSSDSKSIVLNDVKFGTAYSLADYDYKNIKSIELNFKNTIAYASGCLVLGQCWNESHSVLQAEMKDGSVVFEINNPQDVMYLYNYWGLGDLVSVTLNY